MARGRCLRDQSAGSGGVFDAELVDYRAGDEWELQLLAACLRRKTETEREEQEERWW